ncbi:MAG TPA: hypothetical protein VGG72_04150 [Bryobacteraceae bacterium]
MPFNQIIPRPFTSEAVHMYAPSVSGVYGISNAREWIYIGESSDIQAALLAQVQDPSTSVRKHGPTGFVYEICDQALRMGRHGRLVSEYGPACNRHLSRYS